MRVIAKFLAALVLLAIATANPAAAKRLALVIGNDEYANIATLQKAVNDAQSVGEVLSSLGFEVVQATNATRRRMNEALAEFTSRIDEGDTAMLFYAGHGVRIDAKNYLLPVDMPDASRADAGYVESESFALDEIVERIRARNPQMSVLVIDACRNNPFANTATRSLGSGRGLGAISVAKGTFVMYSADEGEAALDRLGDEDRNPNSVFTRELIPLMKEPDLDLVDMAREVRRRVQHSAASIGHSQLPAYYDAVLGDFYFARPGEGEDKQENEQHASLPPVKNTPPSREPDVATNPAPLAGRALVVTASEKDTVRLWDPRAGRLIAELEGEKIVPSAVAITGSGRNLAVATVNGGLFSYSIPDFKKTAAIFPGFRITAISEAPDDVLILGGEDGTMAAVDAVTFETRWKARNHTGIISPILISADGKTALTASGDGTIASVDLADGAVEGRVQTVAGKSITDIAYLSPAVVIAVHEDGTIAHINLKTGQVLSAFSGQDGWISSVEMLAGGEYVTAGVDGSLAFWAVGSQTPLRRFAAHSDVAAGAKTMAIGGENHMITVGFDGSLKIWDSRASRVQADLKHGSAILYFDYASGS